MHGRRVLVTIATAMLMAVGVADAGVYLGYGELNGYISSTDGVFDVQYYGDMLVEFETRFDEETSRTEVMVDLTTLLEADWFSGENSGSAVVALHTESFVQATSGVGGSGELYDPFGFDIADVTSTNLALAPEWEFLDEDYLDLEAAVGGEPTGRGAALQFRFHGESTDLVAVPEPTSLLVLGTVLVIAASGARRRRTRVS